MKFIKNIYLTHKFFLLFGSIVLLLLFSFSFSFLLAVSTVLILCAIAISITDILILFSPKIKISCRRITGKIFSLGSENTIKLELKSNYNFPLKLSIIDEVPVQLQDRTFNIKLNLLPNQHPLISYTIRPSIRGKYHFGKTHIFIKSFLGIIERRISFHLETTVAVYPSVLEMKKFELKAFAKISDYSGIKRIRKLGHSYEFEQIKNYVPDDDFRSINWKATSRKGNIMVNQYEDEKAQQVYSIIDKSRAMKMPFNDLSLLDYSINTTLAISNIALLKHDKAGLISFADKIHTSIPADRNRGQLRKILEALYNEKERNLEANYEALYIAVKNSIKGRSLLFLYTNFESYYALERALPILRKINSSHLLVVVFFENSEIINYSQIQVNSIEEIYHQTIAQKFISEKNKIVQELKRYGIQAILTSPENLSINSINKYLELKSRGMI